jgi:pimeloyl-ACP methyl ester carboxylesterase
MPHATTPDGVKLYYEEVGHGTPIVFVHEFADDIHGWAAQVKFFARRYRTIAFNARGYPPSDVPAEPERYSQAQAAEDIKAILDHLKIDKAHVVGLSMGGFATLHFGLMFPERALSLMVGGAGYGSVSGDRAGFHRDTDTVIAQFEQGGMAKVAEFYTRGPTRVQFMAKDPVGWKEFYDRFAGGSALGHANTMRGVQRKRPSIFELEAKLEKLTVPTLIMTGDEDDPCLEPGIFMKRKIPTSALVVLPKSGHAINLEEPDLFNRAVLDFLTAVDAGRWTRRDPASQTGSATLPADHTAKR